MDVRVTRAALNGIRAAADDVAPEECCGILLGRNGVIEQARPARNVASDRSRRFEIDPEALIEVHRAARSGGPQAIGYFHSHPNGPAAPSAADRADAAGDGRVWAIHGEDGVTFWRDEIMGFVALSYAIEDR